MPNSAKRSSGSTKPISAPYCQPQTSPQSSTGRCIGSSMLPIWGIWPVKKGSTRPAAKNSAASVRFCTEGFIFFMGFLHFWAGQNAAPARQSQVFCVSVYTRARTRGRIGSVNLLKLLVATTRQPSCQGRKSCQYTAALRLISRLKSLSYLRAQKARISASKAKSAPSRAAKSARSSASVRSR